MTGARFDHSRHWAASVAGVVGQHASRRHDQRVILERGVGVVYRGRGIGREHERRDAAPRRAHRHDAVGAVGIAAPAIEPAAWIGRGGERHDSSGEVAFHAIRAARDAGGRRRHRSVIHDRDRQGIE